MPHVIFYLLTANAIRADDVACRLTDKAWHQGYWIHLQTDSAAASQQLDTHLWNWRECSFLPHSMLNPDLANQHEAPITIGHYDLPEKTQGSGLLINMNPAAPAFLPDHFRRICEIVSHNPQHIACAREKFRAYQQLGCMPETRRL